MTQCNVYYSPLKNKKTTLGRLHKPKKNSWGEGPAMADTDTQQIHHDITTHLQLQILITSSLSFSNKMVYLQFNVNGSHMPQDSFTYNSLWSQFSLLWLYKYF